MDLDPIVPDPPPTSIATDATDSLIGYRRNRTATDITWELMVTTNLLSSWDAWPIDDLRVFSEVIDPDVDGDQSAELMRYRVVAPEEGNSLFFRIDVK